MTRALRALAPLARALRNFHDDNALDLAAVVAFYSLLALGPLLYLIGMSLAHVFRGSDAMAQLLEWTSAFLPATAAPLVNSVAAQLPGSEGLVLLAVPGLLWVASSALSSLEHAVNVAFGKADTHRAWKARGKALLLLASAWLVLASSLVASTLLPLLEELRRRAGAVPGLPLFDRALALLALPLIGLGTLLLLYKTLPRARVTWRHAGVGALVAMLLGEIARALFAASLRRSPSYGLLTGGVAAVVSFLLWIYAAVAIVLYGAELVAVLSGSRESARGGGRQAAHHRPGAMATHRRRGGAEGDRGSRKRPSPRA